MTGDPDDPDNLSAPPSLADSFERLLAEPADAFATPLTPGTVVADRYEVVERIGAGAMGMVYLAKDRDLERKIALKLHKKRAGTEQLRREALAMARLAHPNVVTVFEVGEHEGRTFVAMEYVAGTTLRGWIAAEKRTPNEILDVLMSAGEGLIAAHDAKLVHRDFKPENVLLGSDGRARVSDFGLARESGHEVGAAAGGSIGQSTGVAGTPAYMAPEQALGISVDARADQYAFCGVAWEALVGPWPRDDRPTKHPRLRRVLDRGLSKDPSARYPTMRALLSALRGARSRGHIVLGSIAVALFIVAGAVAFAWPSTKRAEIDCDGAGIAVMPIGLDIPARIAASGDAKLANTTRLRLETYRATHAALAASVCRAGLVEHTWSPALYQRGITCLEINQRILIKLLADSATRSNREMLDRVIRLGDESECGDATILASQPPPPENAATLDEMIRVRVLIETALSNYDSDRGQSLEQAIAETEKSSVAAEPVIAPRIDAVRGLHALDQGHAKEGEEALAKAYYGARAIDEPALTLSSVATLIHSTNSRFDDAATANWLKNALADAKRARARAPLAAARLYVVAASITDGFGDPAKSLEFLGEAFQLFDEKKATRSLADAYLVRGSVYISSGKPEMALADYRRGLAMYEEMYGADHPLLARAKLNASAGFTALGKRDESIALAREGEAILDRNPGLTTRDIAQMKLNLASSYINGKDYVKARKYLAESREATVKSLGPNHPDVALIDGSYAYIAVEEKDFPLAAKIARETLAFMEKSTPNPHEDRGQVFLTLADAARGMKDTETAIQSAEASADQYAAGDERKILALAVAAMVANEAGQGARAMKLVEKMRALPAPTDPQLIGRILLEYGRALVNIKGDRVAAAKALDDAAKAFHAGELEDWAKEADAARAKLR